ncbi:hypothetical protein ACH4UM_40755 [Streptomyces sp. NPDC020801]|uniref:hypothetical protein n=1 Tax=unclassified Streptomyces TaxID=2593676 RepID=UPI0037910736
MANIAVRKVTAQYPGARLLEGQGVSPTGPTCKPAKVNSWRFVFSVPRNRTVTIQSTQWGEFAEPVEIARPWLGDQVIDWSPENYLDIQDAAKAARNWGMTDAYRSVTLREPLYPGIAQPYYIFNVSNGSHIAVGAEDGTVTTFN